MGDRLDWVREQAAELSGKLGVKPPQTAIGDNPFLGCRFPVFQSLAHLHARALFRRSVLSELMIPRVDLGLLSDAELRHAVAAEMALSKLYGSLFNATTMVAFGLIWPLLLIGTVFGVYAGVGPIGAAVPAVAILAAAGLVFGALAFARMMRFDADVIKLTGDPRAAVDFLSRQVDVLPGVPAHFIAMSELFGGMRVGRIRRRFGL